MPSNLTFWAARPAPVRRSTRSSSVPVLEPIPNSEAPDMRQLAELTKANPAAATAVRGLIKSGQSVGAALQLMSAAVAAAPTTSAVAGNLRPPTTPTGQGGAGRSRRMSAPPSPSPVVGQKRQADADSVPRKKQAKQPIHRALSPTLDGDGLDIDYGATNRNAFEESWPSSKVELKVKNLDFVAMWYFTPAGCKHAAKERKDGATRPMIYHSDGTFKPAAPPIGEVEDWFLEPHVFRAATDKWVKVAIKMGVSERMQQSMAMLNSAICNHDDWETNPAPLMRWHHHQRETWARDRHAPACYPLEALNPDTYDGIKVKGAVAASSAAEKRAREAEAAIAEMRQEIATLASQRLGDNFRRAGGAGTGQARASHTQTAPPATAMACLRCGSTRSHSYATCTGQARSDGSARQVDYDPINKRMSFTDTGDSVCMGFNTRGCHDPRCRRLHRCTWCKGRDHGHQQCTRAPHTR
ncbi:hypothetical protein A4X03_0g9244 [Tilletia caries]|uniref:Uncharacterized protein n=2 Tax=Tilletia TaxID=13289 RepID=A0A8T8SCB0_9BASI|nr:hypothetical protein A4X03_0g9244 [Tilletia caries]